MTATHPFTGAVVPDAVEAIDVAPGVTLHAVRWHGGDRRPFVLVHGLASNARLWDGVAVALAAAGHPVLAVDVRGHGRSAKPDGGYDVVTVSDDLLAVIGASGFDRPVVVGQSWGGNVVVELAARHPGVTGGVACIDGGAIELAARFGSWEEVATTLRPPPIAGMAADDIEHRIRVAHTDWPETGIAGTLACFEVRADGTVAPWLTLERHLLVLRGLYEHHPGDRLPSIREGVLWIVAGRPTGTGPGGRPDLDAAVGAVARSEVHWIDGDHDLHAQHPRRVAELLSGATGGLFA